MSRIWGTIYGRVPAKNPQTSTSSRRSIAPLCFLHTSQPRNEQNPAIQTSWKTQATHFHHRTRTRNSAESPLQISHHSGQTRAQTKTIPNLRHTHRQIDNLAPWVLSDWLSGPCSTLAWQTSSEGRCCPSDHRGNLIPTKTLSHDFAFQFLIFVSLILIGRSL